MKSLRKSFNSKDQHHHSISTPISAISKPANAVIPPKKVIRALASHRPQTATELPFQKGDFFYVIKEVNDGGAWYEAHNPLTGARGLVASGLFDEFAKNNALPRTFSALSKNSPPLPEPTTKAKPRVYYAVVQHDFVPERPDELDAKAGDAVSVVAQSNREWFVAKPIGKLGRPGLIPVSFVEVRDPGTNQPIANINTLLDQGALPNVEEWKRDMLTYKANSIPLGVLDDPSSPSLGSPPYSPQGSPQPNAYPSPQPNGYPEPAQHSSPNGNYTANGNYSASYQQQTQSYARPETPTSLPDGILLSANVVSFHFEMDEYWFRVHAIFQPYPYPGESDLPPAKQLVLFRAYNDFYDFQVELLNAFPREGGREPPAPRVLPYMPGPAEDVNDEITASRQGELDDYLHRLCELKMSAARYVLEGEVVRAFLLPKPGDVETEVDPRIEDIQTLNSMGYEEDEDALGNGIHGDMARMQLNQGPQLSEETRQRSMYETHQPQHSRSDSRGRGDPMRQYQEHGRAGSSSSVQRGPSPIPPHMREHRAQGSRSNSPLPQSRSSGYSHFSSNSMSGYPADGSSTPTTPGPLTPASTSTRASSGRGSGHGHGNGGAPPISSSNPQTAFVKIKIFDRMTEDLIAIRVHPRVTHDQLMEKVQARLGGEVANLRYRDSLTNGLVGLEGDTELSEWIEGADKHVLYAD